MSSTLPRHVIWESDGLVAYLHPRPWTPGSVILEHRTPDRPGGSVFHLQEQEYLSWLVGARIVAELLCDRLRVQRCALVSRPHKDRPTQVRACLNRRHLDCTSHGLDFCCNILGFKPLLVCIVVYTSHQVNHLTLFK